MLIERKGREKKNFQSLEIGDLFEFDDEVYLKLDTSWSKENALKLKNCVKYELQEKTLVIPLKGKVVIE